MAPGVSLRPVRDDGDFLYRVFASTREDELAPLGWGEAQKAAFLRTQFTAQDRHYRAAYSDAEYFVILRDGEPVGRLYLHRGPAELHVLDIALLPEHRRAGVGGGLLRELIAEADREAKAVRLYVERNNPALRLYERLGFTRIGDTGVYLHMERAPAPPAHRPEGG